jgi:hypothetical protein
MSLLWERREQGELYQVRQAGRSLRLYTNGVFHSQYSPLRPVTGSVWDLLWIPAFFYPAGRLRRILILGVGGGAVIRQLRQFIRPEKMVGVELNRVHLTVARRFFGVAGPDVELQHAEAVAWMQAYRGEPFDMIIDDLFGDYAGEPQRAVYAGEEWAGCLTRHLGKEGLLVSNFTSRLELLASAYLQQGGVACGFRSAFSLSTRQNYNAVGVFLRIPAGTRSLRQRLRQQPGLDPRTAHGLRYRICTLEMLDEFRADRTAG